jgi:hypothetical protein
MTSYSVRGRTIRRAIEDVNKLRNFIEAEYGTLTKTLLEVYGWRRRKEGGRGGRKEGEPKLTKAILGIWREGGGRENQE